MSEVDKEPKDREAFIVEIVDIRGPTVVLDIRIRTLTSWLYYKGVALDKGTYIKILDQQEQTDTEHDYIRQLEILRR